MLIKCPRCQARATLPDSNEGAKVKCGECGRVFIAAPPGSKRVHSSGTNIGALVGVGVAVVALIVFIALRDPGEEEPAVAATKAEPAPEASESQVDEMSWGGPAVRLAVRVHELAAQGDVAGVENLLDAARIWSSRQDAPDDPAAAPSMFAALPSLERMELAREYAEELVSGPAKELVADWHPYDGEVIELSDESAVLRVAATPRDASLGIEKRSIEWKLAKDGRGRWRAWSWERYLTPAEARRLERQNRERAMQKVTLSDGSVVLEREPEPLGHLADTHPDVRRRIDEMYAKMIDLNLTTEATRARDALVEIGRPAIPILLTGLWATPLDSEENAIIANIIVVALRDITDQYMGYQPQVAVGSATGTTEERRASAIKQWFAWWYRNKDTFERKEEATDGLEGLIELTDKEKRWLEKNKD